MSFFNFLHPMFADNKDKKSFQNATEKHQIQKPKTPTMFLQLDNLFAGVTKTKPLHAPVFTFKEGMWTDLDHESKASSLTPDYGSWNQSKFFMVIPEGPYYSEMRNHVGQKIVFNKAEFIVETLIKGALFDYMTYTFSNCRMDAVAIDHDEQQLEIILSCDIIKLAIKEIDPLTQIIGGTKVSQINIPKNEVC